MKDLNKNVQSDNGGSLKKDKDINVYAYYLVSYVTYRYDFFSFTLKEHHIMMLIIGTGRVM